MGTTAGSRVTDSAVDAARERIAIALALADETDANFYRAELLRLRAGTAADDARAADLAESIGVARKQRAFIFELRSAIDDYELRREDARQVPLAAVDRFSAESTWPELARARALLG
jgi:hypothetical protein